MRRTRRETRVVGHHSVQVPGAREAEGGDEVDRVKRRHALGENELGLVEERLLERDERDGGEQLGGGLEPAVTEGEAAQLDAEQAARDVLVEARQLAQHSRGVGLAEEDASDGARVDDPPPVPGVTPDPKDDYLVSSHVFTL